MKKEHKAYIVETANYRKSVSAGSLEAAIKSAFILWPPKSPSLLTRAKLKYGFRKDKESQWHYISTTKMLKDAGYKVNESKDRVLKTK